MGRRRRAICTARCIGRGDRDRERDAARANAPCPCWCTEQKICTVQQTPPAYVYVQNYVRISWGKSHVYIRRTYCTRTCMLVYIHTVHVCTHTHTHMRARVYMYVNTLLYTGYTSLTNRGSFNDGLRGQRAKRSVFGKILRVEN